MLAVWKKNKSKAHNSLKEQWTSPDMKISYLNNTNETFYWKETNTMKLTLAIIPTNKFEAHVFFS